MNFGDLEFDFHVSRKTIPLIVKETCEAIWNGLHHQEMPTPDNEMWLRKAKEFNEITNYPHCIGAVDGKHVRLQCPPNTGSLYYNFKKFNSIVLMAVCDAKYYFPAIDVGAYGREGDSSIFKNSNFYRRLVSGQLDIPQDQCLPTNTQHPIAQKCRMFFLEMRHLDYQDMCYDNIHQRIYLSRRKSTTTDIAEPDVQWNVHLEF